HAYGGNIDGSIIEKIGGASKDPHIVLVEAEHDSKVDGDSVAMQVRDQPAIVVDAIVSLVCSLKTLLRDRLETQEERLAPTSRRQSYELFVTHGIRRALARPPFSERSKSPEELLRIARVSADVIVPEH